MDSCLFGGPPVRDDIIKLGESQIGFMNIFARPLFEAVTDILPAMRFAVDEILANKAVWEKKIDNERQRKKKYPNFSLGRLASSFAGDATPSPFSEGPHKQIGHVPELPTVASATNLVSSEEAGRRGSTGSFHTAKAGSRRSSLGGEKTSRRASAVGIVGQRVAGSRENQSSRRGSGDASLTAILVTQTPNASDKESAQKLDESASQHRKDNASQSACSKKDKDGPRPVTAPSQARRSQGKHHSTTNPSFTSHQPQS